MENKVLEIYFRAFSKLDNSRNFPSLFFSFHSKHITNWSFKFFCLFFLFSWTLLYCWVYGSQREALVFLKSFTIRKIIFLLIYICSKCAKNNSRQPLSFPGGSDGKESVCNAGDCGFDPWVGKIPWREATPVFLPGEFQGAWGLQSMGLQRVEHSWVTDTLKNTL